MIHYNVNRVIYNGSEGNYFEDIDNKTQPFFEKTAEQPIYIDEPLTKACLHIKK